MNLLDYARNHKRLLAWSCVLGISLAAVLGIWPAIEEKFFVTHSEVTAPIVKRIAPTATPTPSPTPPTIPPIELGEIMSLSYGDNVSMVDDLPQQHIREVLLGGDVMLGRSVGFNIVRHQDFSYPVIHIGERLRKADATIVNLENPIVENCPLVTEGMIFCSSPGTVSTLQFMGVDLVNLANNHTLNYGEDGLEQTKSFLENSDIAYTGTGELGVIDVRGLKIGVLGYLQLGGTQGVLEEADLESVREDVEAAGDDVDVLLVNFHWGAEYVPNPTTYQRQLAFAAVDAGADVVFGHHPHWVQGMEIYDGRPIFYSLGNLVFDQMWSQETREGMVVSLSFYKDSLLEVQLFPIFMEDFAQPVWMPRGYGNAVLSRFDTLSQGLMSNQSLITEP